MLNQDQQNQMPLMPGQQEQQEQQTQQVYPLEPMESVDIPEKLRKYIDMDNIAEDLDEKQLQKIGDLVAQGVQIDEDSREEWKNVMEDALKIAKQVKEEKTTPWPGAANVKYPLITNACIQFNSRTNPEIIQGDKVVRVDNMARKNNEDGSVDPITKQRDDRADRLSNHMSYQLIGESNHWRSDTDKLLMILPCAGVVYRKSFYDPILDVPDTELCLPQDIVINNNVASLEKAQRITHILKLSVNDIVSYMNSGLYLKYDLKELDSLPSEDDRTPEESQEIFSTDDEINTLSDTIHEAYEQHRYLDLDGDGYQEPYIVTTHKASNKVLRIVARYDEKSFVMNKAKMLLIKAINYFVDYHFVPSPDGGFHSMGYGSLLLPVNETISTTINQLLDAGTLQNRNGGFIGSGLTIPKGDWTFKLGEWKKITSADGTAISQNIVPLPTTPPSSVLFELLNLMITTGKDLSNVSDILMGNTPPAGVPATTTLAIIEQAHKVYSSMMARIYVSFKKEYERLYYLNKRYGMNSRGFQDAMRLGMIFENDYTDSDYGIFPVADPALATDMQRMAKAQVVMEMQGNPNIDSYEATKYYLDTQKIPTEGLLTKPDPNAPPPQEVLESRARIKQMEAQNNAILMSNELKAMDLELKEIKIKVDALIAAANVSSQKVDAAVKIAETESMLGEKEFEQAQAQEEQAYSRDIMQEHADIQGRLGQLEQRFMQLLGGQEQGEGQQQEGGQEAPSGGQGGMPEEMPEEQPEGEEGSQTPAGKGIERRIEAAEGGE